MRAWGVVLLFWLGVSAVAQTGVGVSPPRAAYKAHAGQTIEGSVAVDHPGRSRPMRVEATLHDVLVRPDGEPVYLEPGSHPRSAAGWITYAPLEFVLEPKQARTVHYSIQVPEGTPDGTYWAVLFFDSGPLEEPQAQGVGVRVRVRVGHVIYVHVGEITQGGRIEGMRYLPPEGKNPARIAIRFRNTGNGLMRLSGRVELRDEEGQVVAVGKVNNAASLPGYAYEIAATLDRTPPPGRYVALVRLEYGTPEVIVGEGEVEVP